MQSPGAVDIRNPPIHDGNRNPAGQQNQQGNQLTKEEREIFNQCQSESYWYRSLPFSVALGCAANFMVRAGILAGHSKYGPWPKTVLFAGIGYFAGKLSYAENCKDKFVSQLPNSSVGRIIRKQRGEVVPDLEDDPMAQIQSTSHPGLLPDGKDTLNTGGDSAYSDYFSGNTSQNNDKSLEERRLGALTYDQLRAEHRQKEMEKPHMQQGALIRPSTPVDPSKVNTPPASYSPQPPAPSSESSNIYSGLQGSSQYPYEYETPAPSKKRTNKYGDEGFE